MRRLSQFIEFYNCRLWHGNWKIRKAFDAIVEKHFSPLIPEYEAITNKFIAAYKKIFPKHLSDDVERMCQGMFSNLYATVIAYARKTNAIEKPSDEYYCEVLLQH